MTDDKTPAQIRAERIAAARAELARRQAEDPEGVQRYEARQAHLAAAAKRERERFETLVLGRDPPPTPPAPRPKGMSKRAWEAEKRRRAEERRAAEPLRKKWSHKQGTPETLENAARTHEGALRQLELNGTITTEQKAWADQIAYAAESIEHDVDVRTASLEARVDSSRRGATVEQRLSTVRVHMAYTRWRELLPHPKRLVLDMIVGDAIGYSVAARRHRVHKRKAKRELLAAIDRWPDCLAWARVTASEEDLQRIRDDLAA